MHLILSLIFALDCWFNPFNMLYVSFGLYTICCTLHKRVFFCEMRVLIFFEANVIFTVPFSHSIRRKLLLSKLQEKLGTTPWSQILTIPSLTTSLSGWGFHSEVHLYVNESFFCLVFWTKYFWFFTVFRV